MNEETGTDLIRAALQQRRPRLAALARDINISISLLQSFCDGHTETLPTAVLDALVLDIWGGHIRFDATADVLEPIHQLAPAPMLAVPQLTINLPKFTPGAAQQWGPQPVDVAPAKPKARSGWRGVWGF